MKLHVVLARGMKTTQLNCFGHLKSTVHYGINQKGNGIISCSLSFYVDTKESQLPTS